MNEFELPPSEPLWLKMAKQVYEQPLILMLLASSVVSALFGSYDDAVCVLVAVGIVLTGMSALMEVERSLIGSCVCTRTTVGEISRSAQQGMIPH
jgi:positive regulator of sigma E activity